MDLSNLTPAPWQAGKLGKKVVVLTPDGGFIDVGDETRPVETDAEFIALARNAFDGDPEALAWWEANRRKRR